MSVERFSSFISRRGNCLEWAGYKDKNGYGRFRLGSKKIGAHRASWIIFKGPIPDGKFVLHTCDNPPCVKLGHLYLGTTKDNTRDMWARDRNTSHFMAKQKAKTVCSRGHKYTPENTYKWKTHRRCKECHKVNSREFYRRKNVG